MREENIELADVVFWANTKDILGKYKEPIVGKYKEIGRCCILGKYKEQRGRSRSNPTPELTAMGRAVDIEGGATKTKTTASHLLLVPLSPAALVMLGRGSLSSTRGLGRGLSSAKLPPLLLLVAMMAGKASSAGLSLTLGFSPGLPQPQDCPRFLDSLEVQS